MIIVMMKMSRNAKKYKFLDIKIRKMMILNMKMSKCEKKDYCDESQKNNDCNDENEQNC